MKTKIYTAKSGAYTIAEKDSHWYRVILRSPNGDLLDKIVCDTYYSAMDYFRAFKGIARNWGRP